MLLLLLFIPITIFGRNFDGAFIVTSTGEVSHVSTKDIDVEEEIRELLGIGHDEL